MMHKSFLLQRNIFLIFPQHFFQKAIQIEFSEGKPSDLRVLCPRH